MLPSAPRRAVAQVPCDGLESLPSRQPPVSLQRPPPELRLSPKIRDSSRARGGWWARSPPRVKPRAHLDTCFADALCVPLNAAIDVRDRELGELAYRSALAGRPYRSWACPAARRHIPSRIVARVSPVAFGIEVSQIEGIPRNLPRYATLCRTCRTTASGSSRERFAHSVDARDTILACEPVASCRFVDRFVRPKVLTRVSRCTHLQQRRAHFGHECQMPMAHHRLDQRLDDCLQPLATNAIRRFPQHDQRLALGGHRRCAGMVAELRACWTARREVLVSRACDDSRSRLRSPPRSEICPPVRSPCIARSPQQTARPS